MAQVMRVRGSVIWCCLSRCRLACRCLALVERRPLPPGPQRTALAYRPGNKVKRVVLLIALALSAAGASAASPSVSDQQVLVVTWSVQGSAALTQNHDRYEEVGNLTVVWHVPVSGLKPGRRFLATSTRAIGTTSAVFGSGTKKSCRGPLSPSRSRLELRMIQAGRDQPSYGTVNFIVSNPFESATSLTCPEGTRASHPVKS